MIISEKVVVNDIPLIRTYSDRGKKIMQDGTGAVYDEALDPPDMGRTYTETDEDIERMEVSDDAVFNRTGKLPAEQ